MQLHTDTSTLNDENDYLNNLTIVTSTRDNIIWVEPFLKSFFQTAFNLNIPIIIVDASTDENYQILLSITEKYQNVQVVTSPEEIKHWRSDWEYGIKQCTTKYILHCHIDIIFLLKHWDIILPELLQTYVIVSGGMAGNITSSFILTTTDLLSTADCGNALDENNNLREMGSIINLANERGKTLLFECIGLHKINQIQYGDICSLNNTDIYYHSYYSSRVYPTTCEPIPAAEFISSNISQRNLEQVPSILLKYLNSTMPLKDFLLQYNTTKITAFTTAWNCRTSGIIDLIDYYLNVVKVDRFIYLDDHSNDGTIECIKGYYSMYDKSVGCIGDDPRLRIADVPYDCYSEQNAMKAANTLMHLDDSDVFIWVDSDEYLYHPTRNVRDIIEEECYAGKNYITTRLTNVYNETNTYNDSKTLLSQVDLYHQHNREYGSAKTPVIIKDKAKKIVYGGSNHYCIIDYKECIDDYDEIPNTLYLLHTCYLTDQFYIDRKVNAKKRLQAHNIYITALDNETGWWSKSLEEQRQSVINDKLHAKSAHEFFN